MSYLFQPQNAIDCFSFIDDKTDFELWDIARFLISIKDVDDVRDHLLHWKDWCLQHPSAQMTQARLNAMAEAAAAAEQSRTV